MDKKVHGQVASNCHAAGKAVKANRKKLRLRRLRHKLKDDVGNNDNSSASLNETTTANVTASAKSEDSVINGADHNNCGLQDL